MNSPLEAWSLLFSDSLLEKIMLHTNESIEAYIQTFKDKPGDHFQTQTYYGTVDLIELKAFIGFLYYAGTHKITMTIMINNL